MQPTPAQFTDIEQELRQALARYEAILASTLDPVVTIDAFGTIQVASDSVKRVFGWTPAELIGRNVNVLMPEPHRSAHDGSLAGYRQTGKTDILGQTREFEGQRKDGSKVPIEISISRVDVPGQEQPLFTGIIHDITERKRAERAVQESERRFREILEEVDLVAVMLDTEGRVTFCNDHLLQLTGWTGEEALGQDWFGTFLPPGHRARVHKVFEEGIKAGQIQAHYENEIVTRNGERRLMAWTNTIIRDLNGDVAGVTGLGVDVTEQRRAEAELARHREHLEEIVAERTSELEASQAQLRLTDRLASIGTLAAGLGHDMNNVLLPVRCRLDALAARELPREAAEHFEAVRKCVQYLQQLADGLHLLALDPEHTEPAGESTELSSWWEQVGSLLARGLPRHVRLATSWPSDLPPVAVAPHRLTQAVLNLLVNAGEAVGDDGKVRVSAETDGRTVRLAVT
ncbi:MAG: PAS domain-containing protein, partial [Planctomycetota bacterium]